MKQLIRSIVFATALMAVVAAALAQTWPQKPVRIIVPYATGGTTDFTARVVAEKLTRRWGVAVIVDNRPGANGNIGTDQLARAPGDGYTLGFVASQHAASPSLFPQLPFALSDFRALTIATQSRMGLLTRRDLPVSSVAELVALAKESPGKLTAAIGGAASVNNLWLKTFEKASGTSFLSVPYRGSGPGHLELLAGRIDVMFDVPSVVLPHIQAGRIKLLAVGGKERAGSSPGTPLLSEVGFPVGESMLTWSTFLVPVRTPPAIIEKISRDVIAVLSEPEVRGKLTEIGLEVVASSPLQADKFIMSEAERVGRIIRENGITPE